MDWAWVHFVVRKGTRPSRRREGVGYWEVGSKWNGEDGDDEEEAAVDEAADEKEDSERSAVVSSRPANGDR